MEYNPKVKLIMRILYPMRKIIKKMDAIRVVHQINSVLQMEEIARRKNGRSGIDNNAVV